MQRIRRPLRGTISVVVGLAAEAGRKRQRAGPSGGWR